MNLEILTKNSATRGPIRTPGASIKEIYDGKNASFVALDYAHRL